MMPATKREPASPVNMPYIGRFAPTPSGKLHTGSLVAALGSYLDARAHRGQWRLRLDDLDRQRSPKTTANQIIAQLIAHGLEPDGVILWQSARNDIYQAALEQLRQHDWIYRCQCSRNQLRAAVQAGALREGLAGPLYPGTCREQHISPEHPAGWRFRVPDAPISVNDRFLGKFQQSLATTVGDPLLKRSDGIFAYHLAEVVDNHALGITDVVRGADLAPLTPLHIALHQVLFPQAPAPRYAHLPLVIGGDGRKLSKTNNAAALDPGMAQQNLVQAAGHLQLSTPDPSQPIEILLDDWTRQWTKKCESQWTWRAETGPVDGNRPS